MKKLLGITMTLGIVTMAMALGMFGKVFDSTYKVGKDSNLGKSGCAVCHVGARGGKLNPYGKDLEAAMKAENSKKLTPAILAKIEGKDSDGDGAKNIDEIKKDQNPGLK